MAAAKRIAREGLRELRLGNIDLERDWGWASEYVHAMHLMLQQENPDDYVIAMGCSRPLRDFVDAAFRHLGLDWREYTVIDKIAIRTHRPQRWSGEPEQSRFEARVDCTIPNGGCR